MLLQELDRYLRSHMAIDELRSVDKSLNGIQVGRRDQEIRRVACAVDACAETFDRAANWEADVLIVHHGLYWGREIPITGEHYERIRKLIDADIALYAVHLPLDMHPEFGNNAEMAKALQLQETKPFGRYHGYEIGFSGRLDPVLPREKVVDTLFADLGKPLAILPFGPDTVASVGIVSGGAVFEVEQAIEQGLDLYITGDASHTVYHRCMEAGINVIFGGHYATEVWGPRALGQRISEDLRLDTSFIDVPTGL